MAGQPSTGRVAHYNPPMNQPALPLQFLRQVLRMACAALLAVATSASMATAIPNDSELALLPDYCRDAQMIRYGDAYYNKSPRADHWVGLMGKTFWAMHHYCWALTNFQRIKVAGIQPIVRAQLLSEIVQDCGYVIENAPKDFVMLPEIYLRVGEAQVLRNMPAEALKAFQTAASLKPDYWPAYVRSVDLQVKLKLTANAKATAAEGLRFSPQSKDLLQRFRSLGGDPASIVPVAPPAAAASAPEPVASQVPPAPSGPASSTVEAIPRAPPGTATR